jgi:2-oxoisovalerate dehydrogenase E1 component alpha subunit
VTTPSTIQDRVDAALPPSADPSGLIDQDGHPTGTALLNMPADEVLSELHRQMVIGRRLDAQATALTRQGRLAVYPSSRGQEACQVGAVLALREQDWLFPTYRDTVAVLARSVPPAEALSLLRGEWHCGYDPYEHRVAPQCTPLATSTLHAVGFARAAQLKHQDQVALVLVGDGATSEGDTHEALNFAGVWRAPVVFLVQNNGYAISVPLAKQTAAPALAYRGVGSPGVRRRHGRRIPALRGRLRGITRARPRRPVKLLAHVTTLSGHGGVPGTGVRRCRGSG